MTTSLYADKERAGPGAWFRSTADGRLKAGWRIAAFLGIFGYLRIYGYLSTSQLWMSIGMHTGWNFFQATVFGYAASGHAEEQTLLTHDMLAANWLTGGGFGPEASVLTIPRILA